MTDFIVAPVPKKVADRWVVAKHYSRRRSIFWAGFGLWERGQLQGVCVFGQPSPAVQKHAFSHRDFKLYELSRLVIQTQTKNAASVLVGRALRQLATPCAVVSYADSEMGHAGIVYQATNWVYTGATVSHDKAYLVDGKRVHPMTLRDRGITSPAAWARENGIKTVAPMPKHRYFFFCGDRRQIKAMRRALRYPIQGVYPKMPKRMYDAGPLIVDRCPPAPSIVATK